MGQSGEEALKYSSFMAKTYKGLNYSVLNVAEGEIALGKETLKKLFSEAKTVLVSANIKDASSKKHLFAPFIIKEVSGIKFLITGVLPPLQAESQLAKILQREGLTVADPASEISEILKRERPNYDFAVVLSALDRESSRKLSQAVMGIDLILGSRNFAYGQDASPDTRTVFISNMPKGGSVSLLSLQIQKKDSGFIDLSKRETLEASIDRINSRLFQIQSAPYDRNQKRSMSAPLIERRDNMLKEAKTLDALSRNTDSNFIRSTAVLLNSQIEDHPQTRKALQELYK